MHCALEYRFLRFLPKYFLVNHYCLSNYYLHSIHGDSDTGPVPDSFSLAFGALLQILFHTFPVSRVHFKPFKETWSSKVNSTKVTTTYEIASPGHLGVCALSQTTCTFMAELRKHAINETCCMHNNIWDE